MSKMKKVYDQTYKKGAQYDDDVTAALIMLNDISRKPEKKDFDLVDGDIGDLSYWTIYEKGFRIVVYIENLKQKS